MAYAFQQTRLTVITVQCLLIDNSIVTKCDHVSHFEMIGSHVILPTFFIFYFFLILLDIILKACIHESILFEQSIKHLYIYNISRVR
jgi:hypothetical protein